MTFIDTCNFVPELEGRLDTRVNESGAPLEIVCWICRTRRLSISALAQSLIEGEESTDGRGGRGALRALLYAHGFEQTLVLPCGHIFGDRCLREGYDSQGGPSCPSCGYKMAYKDCGHAIAPAVIPVRCSRSLRETFPLTIPEGGEEPRQCKECRWEAARAKLSFALDSKCVVCAAKASAGLPFDPEEHRRHRAHHVDHGVREAIAEVMQLIQPDFITRESGMAQEKTRKEKDVRDVNTALLVATAMTELEGTIWYEVGPHRLTKAQAIRRAADVQAIDICVLGWLMNSGNGECRRMW
ncbi:hypothetical protein F5Y17DRAFT_81525 [Xylariaceae sp. FL0594]|nr:hypothetical protein F5Y17DRAFT_81525 [Xylariaceae sp. FL0594]